VAAPVHGARGAVVGAVAVWGPAHRVTPARVPELAAQARAAAGAISAKLGASGSVAQADVVHVEEDEAVATA
jgi:DNA-binding IclR family transcriptional regulator